MDFIDKSYLHPVLRPGYDDVAGALKLDLTIGHGAGFYQFGVAAVLENETIQGLIDAGKAKVYLFIHCKANFYRRALPLTSLNCRVEIPMAELSGNLEICLVISAVAELKYCNSAQHPDYLGQTFDLVCGDILLSFAGFYSTNAFAPKPQRIPFGDPWVTVSSVPANETT